MDSYRLEKKNTDFSEQLLTARLFLAAALKSGNDGAIRLAAQLAGVKPCEKCGYVWNH